MIRHMRHGSPPRLMALQSILSPNRRESLPTPSAGVRMIGETVAVADALGRDLGDGAAAADPESAAAIDPAHAHDGVNAKQRDGAPAQGGWGLGRVGQEVECCGWTLS